MTAMSAEPERIRAEVAQLLAQTPELAGLVRPQAGEPDQVDVQVLRSGPSPLWLIPVDVPGASGRAWACRLLGAHVPETENDLERLEAFGIERVFCLVPPNRVGALHGAHRYVAAARARFGSRFECLDIEDHDIPSGDTHFEEAVDRAWVTLRAGNDVLVHCVGGCGRTGMFLACIMVTAGSSPEAAIRAFRNARRCGPETAEQVAYVFRFAERRRRRADDAPVRVSLTRGPDGRPKQIERGGLATIVEGRLHFSSGRRKRVAVKLFARPFLQRDAEALARCIEALSAAGVRLPKMGVMRLEDGRWVQISQLFGSSKAGSKLHQPGTFYRELDAETQRFAADQLARVANAGYRPSVDLFLAFRPPRRGVIPLDLDLILPETDPTTLGAELIKRLLQVSGDLGDRDALLSVALASADEAIGEATCRLLRGPGPYQRLWRHL